MPSEYLFALVACLLPVAALSGWYYGRRESSVNGRVGGAPHLAQDYFKGLNYLLNDRPDKAIEIFIKVLETEDEDEAETVETHLALGNLFRRRGEVDRAIRIHENLVAKSSLDADQHGQAVLELGLDYMRSGLLDRAETLFKELQQHGTLREQALRRLIDIYQQEQDWDKALEYVMALEQETDIDLSVVRAHLLCEKAALVRGTDAARAIAMLDDALRVDQSCVRASLAAAAILQRQGNNAGALRYLTQIEEQDIDFLPEAIGPMVKCYRALGREGELETHLQRLSARHAGVTPVLVLAELVADREGLEAAKKYIVEELKTRPTIRGIDRLIEYSLTNSEGEVHDNLVLLKETTSRLVQDKLTYRCGTCGFTGRQLHWQCPSCNAWNTVKPIHGIEGE